MVKEEKHGLWMMLYIQLKLNQIKILNNNPQKVFMYMDYT